MGPLSKAGSKLASMIMSDSEPDFDDIETIPLPSARDASGKPKGSKRAPQTESQRFLKDRAEASRIARMLLHMQRLGKS
jgi:hypothetical protein